MSCYSFLEYFFQIQALTLLNPESILLQETEIYSNQKRGCCEDNQEHRHSIGRLEQEKGIYSFVSVPRCFGVGTIVHSINNA